MTRVWFPAVKSNGIFFSLRHRCVQTGSGTHPASYSMDSWGFFHEGKAAGCEADHSPQSSAEVKNTWSYTSTPPVRLNGVVPS
jgi:hypothetical protein